MAGERVDQRQELVFGDEIDLGEHEEDGAVELADKAKEKFIFAGPVGALVPGGGGF